MMTMAQIWTVIGIMAGALVMIIGMTIRVVKTEIGGLRGEMIARFEGVGYQFASVNQRFDGVNERFDAVNQRFDGVNQRFDGVNQRFDAVERRLEKLELTDREVHALTLKVFGADRPEPPEER